MKARVIASLTVLALTTACTSGVSKYAARDANVSADMKSYFAQRLDAGRHHMKANRPGAALEAFRQASYDPRFAADAYNGMAVAYTAMGRPDVARDMFLRAIEKNPLDERFSRNLARLDAVPLPATDDRPMLAAVEALPENASFEQAFLEGRVKTLSNPAIAIAAKPDSGMRPNDNREVFIKTASLSPVAVAPKAATPVIVRNRIAKAPVVYVGAQPPKGDFVPSYPVRVAITGAPQRERRVTEITQPKAGYPVRVALGSAE